MLTHAVALCRYVSRVTKPANEREATTWQPHMTVLTAAHSTFGAPLPPRRHASTAALQPRAWLCPGSVTAPVSRTQLCCARAAATPRAPLTRWCLTTWPTVTVAAIATSPRTALRLTVGALATSAATAGSFTGRWTIVQRWRCPMGDTRVDGSQGRRVAPRDRVPTPVTGEPDWVLDAATLAGMFGLPLATVAAMVGDDDLAALALSSSAEKDGE